MFWFWILHIVALLLFWPALFVTVALHVLTVKLAATVAANANAQQGE